MGAEGADAFALDEHEEPQIANASFSPPHEPMVPFGNNTA